MHKSLAVNAHNYSLRHKHLLIYFRQVYKVNWQRYLDLSRSRDVVDHVANRFAICHFLLVSNWNRVSISNRFWDICIQIYLGHDLVLSGSRDVTGHVTIWYPGCHLPSDCASLRVSVCKGSVTQLGR